MANHVKKAYEEYMELSRDKDKRNIKYYLKKNKIWFETVMYIILSICAIIVSINSNKISESQFEYNLNKDKEYFYVQQYYDQDNFERKYIVNNSGGNIKECFVYVDFYILLKNNNKFQYFKLHHLASNVTQEYVENSKYLPFYFEYPKLLDKTSISTKVDDFLELMDYKDIKVDYISYVTIDYITIMNENKKKYYYINGFNIDEIESINSAALKEYIYLDEYNDEDFISELYYEISKFYEKTNK